MFVEIGFFFYIFRTTQEHGELLDVMDINSLHYSKFNAIYPTKIIIHGFGGGRNLVPSTDLRNGMYLHSMVENFEEGDEASTLPVIRRFHHFWSVEL